MRTHTKEFKREISEYGREIDTIITYKDSSDVSHEISDEDIKNAKIITNSDLLTSVMKQVEINCVNSLKTGTQLNVKSGVKVNDSFEYVDFGDYLVYLPEWQADTQTYNHVCYDYMLKSMIEYKKLNISYPISVKNYIKAICDYIGIEFANINDSFVNCDKMIQEDYFENSKCTFRDILDQLAKIVAGFICIDGNNKLEIRYPKDSGETLNKSFLSDKNVTISKKYGPINAVSIVTTDSIDNPVMCNETSINNNGLCEIEIKDNPFLSGNDKTDYLKEIFDKLNGLYYFILDIKSTGIEFLELGDMYYWQFADNPLYPSQNLYPSNNLFPRKREAYKCLLLNSELNITSGLSEDIYCEEPKVANSEYKNIVPDNEDMKNAIANVNKANANILLKVNKNDIISSINLSPEKTKILTEKLDVDAIAKFTNSKLANSGSTIINGDNVTTGKLKNSDYEKDETGKCIDGMCIDLDEGTIDSKNFKLDTSGNVNVVGYIETNRGLLTNLQFKSGYLSTLGQSETSYSGLSIEKSRVELEVCIPENFEIVSAILTLDVFKTKNIFMGDSEVTNYGKVQNIRLYKENNSTSYNNTYMGTFYLAGSGSEITGAFGANGFTTTTIEKATVDSIDIKNSINSKGITKLYLETADALLEYNHQNVVYASQQTQIASAVLNVLGYKKIGG